jgi:hypothetical protein
VSQNLPENIQDISAIAKQDNTTTEEIEKDPLEESVSSIVSDGEDNKLAALNDILKNKEFALDQHN